MFINPDYNIFFEFIKNYSVKDFTGIKNQDHFMVRFNRVLDKRRQFFYVGDILRLQILYTSPQILDIYGIEPEKFDLSYNLINTHPSEIQRRSRARVNIIELGQKLFMKKSGHILFSANFMVKAKSGKYLPILVQCYLFYSSSPVNTVYILQIHTLIESLSEFIPKRQFHWYTGIDLSYFRYPDEELLRIGSNLSDTEIKVIRSIQKGMNSKEIGLELFISPYTVYTHRRNILKKTGKSSIGEVIYELEFIGMI